MQFQQINFSRKLLPFFGWEPMGGLLAQQTRLYNFRGMEAPPVPAATQQLFLSLEESLEIPRSLGTDSIVQVRRECVLNHLATPSFARIML